MTFESSLPINGSFPPAVLGQRQLLLVSPRKHLDNITKSHHRGAAAIHTTMQCGRTSRSCWGGIKSCRPLVSPKTASEAMTAFFRLLAFGHNVSGLGSPRLRRGSHRKSITMTMAPNKKSITLHTTASQSNQRGPPQTCWTGRWLVTLNPRPLEIVLWSRNRKVCSSEAFYGIILLGDPDEWIENLDLLLVRLFF